MPGADQGHGDQPSRDPPVLGPFGCPDSGDTRKSPPQDRRRATRFPRQPIDFVALDVHTGKGLFESAVVEQVERDVGLGIDNVAGANGDAMPLAVDGGQLAFGRAGVDDREERRRRCRQLAQRLRRLEHRRELPPSRGDTIVREQAREKCERFIPGIGRNHERTLAWPFQPLAERVAVRGYRGLEHRGRHLRIARFGPALPASVECLETFDRHAELLGKPDLGGDGLFQPLLQIAGVERPHPLPVAGAALATGPFALAGPIAGRDEDEGGLRPLGRGDGGEAGSVVVFGLAARVPVRAELPAGPSLGDPRRRRTRLGPAVPSGALRVVVAWKVNLTKVVTGRMNQLAQKHRQQTTSVEIALRPIMDLPGLDGQEARNISTNRDGLRVSASMMAVERRLVFEKLPAIGPERLFELRCHVGGQR